MTWAWFIVNIMMPAALPLIGVALLYYATPPQSRGHFNVMSVMKDGQLGWIAAALSSAALYEFIDVVDIYNHPPPHPIPMEWFLVLIPLIMSLIGGILVGAQGAIYSVDLLEGENIAWKQWLGYYQTFIYSLIMTLASAVAFAAVHLGMIPEATYRFTGGQ